MGDYRRECEALAGCGRLERLCMARRRSFSDEEMEAILPLLGVTRVLMLTYEASCQISSDGLVRLFEAMERGESVVEELIMPCQVASVADMRVVGALCGALRSERNPLRELVIGTDTMEQGVYADTPFFGAIGQAVACKTSNLRTLELYHTRMTRHDIIALSPAFERLDGLLLPQCIYDNYKALRELGGRMGNLKRLSLRENGNFTCMKALIMIGQSRQLEELDISANQLCPHFPSIIGPSVRALRVSLVASERGFLQHAATRLRSLRCMCVADVDEVVECLYVPGCTLESIGVSVEVGALETSRVPYRFRGFVGGNRNEEANEAIKDRRVRFYWRLMLLACHLSSMRRRAAQRAFHPDRLAAQGVFEDV